MNRDILLLTDRDRTSVVAGVCRYARSASWQMHIAQISSPNDSTRALVDLWKPAGCIMICGNFLTQPDATLFGNVPAVFIEADPRFLPRTATIVLGDNEKIGQLAAKELLSTGRDPFAFVGALNDLPWSRGREAAFIRTLRLNGKARPRRLHPKAKAEQEVKLVHELTGFIRALPDGCGIFVAHDFMAEKVLGVCRKLGRAVPRDLAVVSVDNHERICLRTDPQLSSIVPDFAQSGYCAARALDDLLARKTKPKTRHIIRLGPLALVRRASSSGVSAYGGSTVEIMTRIRESEGRISPAMILKSLPVARRTAEQQFRRATGMSILEAVRNCRFETACLLLRKRTLPQDEIAQRIGYRSTAAFDRFFKSRTGQTPNAWRNAFDTMSANR